MLKAANTRETVRMALLSERADGALAYNPAQSVELSVSGNEFSRLEKTFDYRPAADQRNLYVAVWSDSGASLLVDEMNLQEAQAAPPSVPPAPKRIAYDFESGIGGWSGVHASTRATRVASAGRLALKPTSGATPAPARAPACWATWKQAGPTRSARTYGSATVAARRP